jgi:hypothetical protein
MAEVGFEQAPRILRGTDARAGEAHLFDPETGEPLGG